MAHLRALLSVQLLSSLVKPGTHLSTAISELRYDILAVQHDLSPSATADKESLILNPIRQKSLLFPLFGYPSLLNDYCRGNTGVSCIRCITWRIFMPYALLSSCRCPRLSSLRWRVDCSSRWRARFARLRAASEV